MKNDIANRDDIKLLVDTFYNKIKNDSTIAHIFNDIAKVDWGQHLPKMYLFWSALLLGEYGFSGNPMQKHLELSRQTPMTETQFSEWLIIFTHTVDELFEGEKAEEAKTKAANIAQLMLHKIRTVSK